MKMPATAIREEIYKSGVISFARFMELTLYCPETGYYETKKDIIGPRGDFITSVSAALFGELLAFQFASWLEEWPIAGPGCANGFAGAGCRLAMVEAGAHGGQLAKDILSWLQANRPRLFEQIEYVMVEPSARRREWQQETLTELSSKVRWVSQLSELKNQESISGLIFSNELLDAFPVHRYGWDAAKREWFEWGVALAGESFC
jgi:SAM-dependent MidA family methyltransferase